MLADDLVSVLRRSPGATAAEIAACLAPDHDGGRLERAVAFALFASHGRFRTDGRVPSRWWLATDDVAVTALAGPAPDNAPPLRRAPVPLYAWQEEALQAWRGRGGRGVVEAVTGTGKTMVGVAATLAELDRRGQVLVLVPTVELQRQWAAELYRALGDAVAVGCMGDGAADTLTSHDVVVAVVNSARVADVRPIRRGGLLVADECHRYGSAANRLALDERFTRRLGLSATYAREDDGNLDWLDPYFGGTCFRMGYERAVSDGVTAGFSVALVGVQFDTFERATYDELSLVMRQLRARLVERHGVPAEPFEAFLRAVMLLADGVADGGAAGGGGATGVARKYRMAMLERRRLLGDTPAKTGALVRLAPAIGAADRTIVFTHSIATSERAAASLRAQGLRAGAVHSELTRPARRAVLAGFAAGELDAISAPRVLDEGIDVPAADLAVIVGASRSRRQMVQRMGRVLRRKLDGRPARFAVVFVEATVEDPAWGAHEAFLHEVTGVADDVRRFGAELAAADPASVCDYLAHRP